MDIDSEIVPSPPSAVQRETVIDLVDPVAPVDVPRDIAVGHKRPFWAQQNLQEAEGHVAPRGTFRESKRPQRFSSYVSTMSHIIDIENYFHGEAAGQQVLKDAMTKKYQSIMKNDVWDIVLRPEGKSMVTSNWIYKIKHAFYGSVEKYKVIFVARRFSQVEGIDYEETFSHVSQYTSICTIISFAASMVWRLHHMDVKIAFLNGDIEEEVYIEQPDGFVIHEKESHVCRLNKALYGLKQESRAWYEKIDGYLMSFGFNKSVVDPNLYYHIVGYKCLVLALYVDYLFLTSSESIIVECKRALNSKFKMKDLGMMHYFLGLEVWHRTDDIFISQGKYIVEILKKFGMTDCKSMLTPMVMDLKKMNEASTDSCDIDPHIY
jgi:hypothetical protein